MRGLALIVDDDQPTRDLVVNLLSSTGYEVMVLTSGAYAQARLEAVKFSVVLVDLQIPSGGGFEVVRQSRASGYNKTTPVILLSNDQSVTASTRGLNAGASFFVYKPADKNRLLQLFRAIQGAVEQEQRRFRRVSLHSKVQLVFDRAEWEGETIDVSLNGMLVKGLTVIPAGSKVLVTFYPTSNLKPITCTGSIMRVSGGNQMGIRLNELGHDDSQRLQEFLLPLILEELAIA